jgi:membrane protein involved in colicin uptake
MAKEKKGKSTKKESAPKKAAPKKTVKASAPKAETPAETSSDDATIKADEDARIKAEEEARLKAEEEARIKAEEEARLKAEEEARVKAEEEARKKAEEEARIKAEEEARKKAEEEARIKAEEEARKKAEEEARIKAEEEARLKAEEEAAQAAASKAGAIASAIEAKVEFIKSVKPPANVKLIAAGVAALFVMIAVLSMGNTSNYYIKTKHGATYVYQGAFAPVGKNLLATIPGEVKLTEEKDVYTEAEIRPILFRSYMDEALALKNDAGSPNFDAIICRLHKAQTYATTEEETTLVKKHLSAVTAIKGTYCPAAQP